MAKTKVCSLKILHINTGNEYTLILYLLLYLIRCQGKYMKANQMHHWTKKNAWKLINWSRFLIMTSFLNTLVSIYYMNVILYINMPMRVFKYAACLWVVYAYEYGACVVSIYLCILCRCTVVNWNVFLLFYFLFSTIFIYIYLFI